MGASVLCSARRDVNNAPPADLTADAETAIAQDIGLASAGEVAIAGVGLDTLSDDALRKRVADITVYARVTAEHKQGLTRHRRSVFFDRGIRESQQTRQNSVSSHESPETAGWQPG